MVAEPNQKLVVRFLDSEVLEGTPEGADLNSPDFLLRISGEESNNHAAQVPLAAVKRLQLSSGPADEHATEADKMVALRFRDGEVLRGYLNGSLRNHPYGISLSIYSPDKTTMETIAIPFTSLKAVFYLKEWDSRKGDLADGEDGPPLVQLLGDMKSLSRMRDDGLLEQGEYLERRKDLLDRF